MNLMATKRSSSSFATDRISDLPCNVMDDILKYLPLREAARTSILSRWWRYKWRTIPHLVFDQNFKETLGRNYKIESVIYQVLLLHRGPIVKFTYDVVEDYFFIDCKSRLPAVDQWLHFLSDHCIEEITLCFSDSGLYRAMSHHLFSFDQLQYLCLVNCNLKPPSAFKGLGRLVTLDLDNVVILPREFTRFISKCPMLEYLNLYRNNVPALVIDASKLKSFCFYFSGELPPICLKNTSLLEEVSITKDEYASEAFDYDVDEYASEIFQGPQTNLIEFFGQLSSIKKLYIDCGFLQSLARGGMAQKLPNNLSRLMVLALFEFDFADIVGASCAVCLIRSSPNLRTLEITSTTAHYVEALPVVQFLKEQEKCKLTLSHLKNVKIDNFSGARPEMKFVKLLLSAASTLIKLELKLNHHIIPYANEKPWMSKELASFRRASSTVEIIYFQDHFDV